MAKPWAKIITGVLLTPLILFLAYFAYSEWDMRRVKRICSEIQPGASLTDVRRIVADAGLEKFLAAPNGAADVGVRNNDSDTWDIMIPAPTTLGDLTCFITHDGKTVIRTEVPGRDV